MLAAAAEGLTWCAGAFLLADDGHYDRWLVVVLLSTAIASGSAYVYSADLRSFRLFFYPVMAPYIVLFLLFQHPLASLLEVMTWVYMIGIPIIASRTNRQLLDNLRLRFGNQALAEDLSTQKERAEEANLAKSRFLASASHDLRQPVHALGLFLGALRLRRMDREARRLVEHIGASLAALDDLFAALLDISKLDARAVHPEFQSVPIGPLIDRVVRDHMPEAVAKGLVFRVVRSSLCVRSDPVLLERIVRNLLGNAVRHTSRGGVLIGVRRAGGLRLAVYDTGPGISPDSQARIFEEFYQLENPERDRSKGLGLGLAIVRRISELIEAPVSLVSRERKGSCFAVALVRSEQTNHHVPPPPADVTRGRGLILVVDDEQSIQDAMAELLPSWGYDVIVAGSLDDMRRRMADVLERPGLLICDYRLREDDNGIDVVAALRADHGTETPAILITGDTAPDRISAARLCGLLLLHKPVPAARLRAAIANLARKADTPSAVNGI
jgi:signal transduction histidine kinase/CheY-like chemotaxis protein